MMTSRKVDGRWRLYFDDAMGMQVGPRICRGDPLPVNQFEFDTREEAEEAMGKFESYILTHQHKQKKKRK